MAEQSRVLIVLRQNQTLMNIVFLNVWFKWRVTRQRGGARTPLSGVFQSNTSQIKLRAATGHRDVNIRYTVKIIQDKPAIEGRQEGGETVIYYTYVIIC